MKSNKLQEILEKSRIVIAVHEFVLLGGPGQDLEKFFLNNKVVSLLFISHPLLNLKESYQSSSRYRYYEGRKRVKEHTAFHFRLPTPFLFMKDFLHTLFWGRNINGTYDLFVGLGPLNAFSGLILKKFGVVRRVVLYSIDYFPKRFQNRLMNFLYHKIDKFCVRFADETWNVGSRMAKAREENNGMSRGVYNKQYYVPIGVWFRQVRRKPFEKIDKKKLIYAGHLAPHMGVDLIIKAMPKLIKKIPDVQLEIIGTGESEGEIKKLAKDLGVASHIAFHGWIGNRKVFEQHLLDGAIGLAPFRTDTLDNKVKNADPGKLKDYMYCGMPVITTKVVASYPAIKKAKAGIIIDYNVDQMVRAIVRLLQKEQLLHEYRENAVRYVKQFDWEEIFGKNLKRLWGLKK